MRRQTITALFVLCTAAIAHTATFNVSPAGKDSNPGTPDAPFATLQKGVDMASAGDTVIGDGVFVVPPGKCTTTDSNGPSGYALTVSKPGTAAAPITIKAAQSHSATLNAGLGCYAYILFAPTAAFINIEGFVLDGGYWTGLTSKSSNVNFRDLEIRNVGNIATDTSGGKAGILTHPGTMHVVIDGLFCHDIGRISGANKWHDHCLYLESTDTTVTHSTFYNFNSGWAIAAKVGNLYRVVENLFFGPAGAGRPGQIVFGDSLGTPITGVVVSANKFINSLGSPVVTCRAAFTGQNSIDNNFTWGAGITNTLGPDVCGGSTGTGFKQTNNTVIDGAGLALPLVVRMAP